MPKEERRWVGVFIRLTPKEKEVLDQAVKIKYDNIHGALNAFCRRALMAYAVATIRKAQGTGKK